ncbi:type II toxin-antitoxin system Phd/YefM family antitoxin [soil metagenome]|jgi:prevent-host-death family protein|nr:type II toxin-antitoxin system Phd/YefM family antitoxin [Deinococcota bacterium]
MKRVSATEFKAKCLAILDEVKRTGEPVTILKRGKPVAQLVPPLPRTETYPQYNLIGTGEIVGDIIEPAVPAEDWDAVRGEL